ncbi:MAG TPA: hypothetical protein VLL76_11950 [Candidatus Omnitrophota bacterium]|nr:hypothetical protein [Candidatus Omnitrophota bacterium]
MTITAHRSYQVLLKPCASMAHCEGATHPIKPGHDGKGLGHA